LQKQVRFADPSISERDPPSDIDTSPRGHRGVSDGRQSSKSSNSEPNKLAELNNILKGVGKLDIKEDEENEFQSFIRKLQEKDDERNSPE
jgi:hypothetical protein